MRIVVMSALALAVVTAAGCTRAEKPPGIVITSPEPGTSVRPGQEITVSIDVVRPEALGPVRRVHVSSQAFAEILEGDPPWTVQLTVDRESIGELKLVAAGLVGADGEKPQLIEAPDVSIEVDLGDLALQRLSINPSLMVCDDRSPEIQLSVHGRYSDGVDRNLGKLPSGTTYSSDAPEIASVDDGGLVTCHRNGEARISVDRDGIRAEARIVVEQR